MDLDGLAAILAVERHGSLSGSAERLGISTSTVWRRIAALERELGLRLVDRRPDCATLTPHGRTIAGLAHTAADHAAQILRTAAALREGVVDPVRVSATEPLVAEVLAPKLPALWAVHPDVRVTLSVSNELVSLARREADIAIRMTAPTGDSLVVRKLPPARFGLYATRAYLGRRKPATIDLAAERLLVYDASYGRLPELAWLDAAGLWGAVRLRTSSTRALVQATRAGAGIGLLPAMFVRPRDHLVEIPGPAAIPPRDMWVVVHRDLRRSRAIRAVHDWLYAEVSEANRRRPVATPGRNQR